MISNGENIMASDMLRLTPSDAYLTAIAMEELGRQFENSQHKAAAARHYRIAERLYRHHPGASASAAAMDILAARCED